MAWLPGPNRRDDIGIPGTVATVTGAIVQSAAHLFGYSGPDPQEWGRNVQRGSDEWQTSNNEQWEQLANLRRRAFPHGLFLNTRAGQAMKSSQDPEMRRVYYMLQSLDPTQQIDMMAAITRKHGGRRTLSEFSALLKKAINGDPGSQDQVMGMVYAGVAGIATEHLLPLVGEGLGVRGPRLGLRGDVPESRGLRPSARQERASAGSAGNVIYGPRKGSPDKIEISAEEERLSRGNRQLHQHPNDLPLSGDDVVGAAYGQCQVVAVTPSRVFYEIIRVPENLIPADHLSAKELRAVERRLEELAKSIDDTVGLIQAEQTRRTVMHLPPLSKRDAAELVWRRQIEIFRAYGIEVNKGSF